MAKTLSTAREGLEAVNEALLILRPGVVEFGLCDRRFTFAGALYNINCTHHVTAQS